MGASTSPARGLRDAGWRFQSPSEIGRVYADYRPPHARFRVPHHRVGRRQDLLRCRRRRAGGLHPRQRAGRSSLSAVHRHRDGQIQVTGKVAVSPTWDLSGVAYVRRFSQFVIDGNDGNFEIAAPARRSAARSASRTTASPGRRPVRPGVPQPVPDRRGERQRIPFQAGVPYGTPRYVRTEATSYGGTLQATTATGSSTVRTPHRRRQHRRGVLRLQVGQHARRHQPRPERHHRPEQPDLRHDPGPRDRADPHRRRARHRAEQRHRLEPLHGPLRPSTPSTSPTGSRSPPAPRLNFARVQHPGPHRFSPGRDRHAILSRINPVARPDVSVLSVADALRRLFRVEPGADAAGTRLRQPGPALPAARNSLVADPPLRQVEARTYEAGFRGTVPDITEGDC